ncbi:ABC transporter ATP-binding protein [Halorhabdus salina]|uniref:ABC transporter ATP-binding protein n=1 Tax=Halorhabdus salina TaxID=2750670 RepID=UPI0015EEC7BC|nr:ABC transporter ATP-binding protein [Halorhabdus salina]
MTLALTDLRATVGTFELGPIGLTVGSEVLSVLGPSGSGKTTLLQSIAGIVTPEAGTVALDGRELTDRPLEERGVGLVFQDGALFPHMTAHENVAYAAADDDRVADLAELLELDGVLDRRPPDLSGGEAKRVALARTLAADPDALLLDEPLASLDAPIRRRLRSELRDIFADLDVPVIYVTHDRRAAMALGDRVAIVRDGVIEQVDDPETVIDRPASRFVARFTGTDNRLDGTVSGQTDLGAVVRVGDLELRTDVQASSGTAVTACVHPSRIELGREADGDENVFAGRVRRRLYEGDAHRVAVKLAGVDATVTVSVRPQSGTVPENGRETAVWIPPDAIHLLD